MARCLLGCFSGGVDGNDYKQQARTAAVRAPGDGSAHNVPSAVSQAVQHTLRVLAAGEDEARVLPQRIKALLEHVGTGLGTHCGLLSFPSGLLWRSDGAPGHENVLSALAEALEMHQADPEILAVVHGSSISCCPASAGPLVLQPGEVLAVPTLHGGSIPAVLLLRWGGAAVDRPTGCMDGSPAEVRAGAPQPPAAPGAPATAQPVTLTPLDLCRLQQLAQSVVLRCGLLGNPQHCRFVQQATASLSALLTAPGLHDALSCILDSLPLLLQIKFALHFHPVLVASHGPNAPGMLFARRAQHQVPDAAYAARLPIAAMYHSQSGPPSHAGLAAASAAAWGSTGPGAPAQPGVTGGSGAVDPSSASLMSLNTGLLSSMWAGVPAGGTAASGVDGGSRVRAVKAVLVHTLLVKAQRPEFKRSSSSGAVVAECLDTTERGQVARVQQPRTATPPPPAQPPLQPQPQPPSQQQQQPRPQVRPQGPPRLHTVLLPNAAACLMEEQQPYRDVMLCSSITGHKVASLLICTESDPQPSSAGQLAEAGKPTCCLGVYLASPEPLPASLMQLVAREVQGLLEMFLPALHAAISSSVSASGTLGAAAAGAAAAPRAGPERLQAEWRTLQEQLGVVHPLVRTLSPTPSTSAPEPVGTPPAPGSAPRAAGPTSNTSGAPGPSSFGPGPGRGHSSRGMRAAPAAIPSSLLRSNSVGTSQAAAPAGSSGGLLKRATTTLLSGLGVKSANAAAAPAGAGGLAAPSGHGARVGLGLAARGGPGSPLAQVVATGKVVLGDTNNSVQQEAFPAAAQLYSPAVKPPGDRMFSSSTEILLEKPPGPAPLDVMVYGIRSHLTSLVADTDSAELSRTAATQDLAAMKLLDVLGRGGQGVVFRGMLHGLEMAVKVLADAPALPGQDAAAAPGAPDAGNAREAAVPAAPAAGAAGAAVGGGAGGAEGVRRDEDLGCKPAEARQMRQAKRGAMEVAVTSSLSHPNIVQVYATFSNVVVVRCHFRDSPLPELRLCLPDDRILQGKPPGPLNQVLALEFCDAGTLLTAAREGAFRQPFESAGSGAAWPVMPPLYTSLLEVALALRYLHARRLVHCDVKAANVLLKSSTRDPRGWTCKVSDLGCVQLLSETDPKGGHYFRTSSPVGTTAWMAPENFVQDAHLTSAIDIYSFGILMWELLMVKAPYAGLDARHIPRQVLCSRLRPTFHPLTPPEYRALAMRCWSSRPERRPTAVELVAVLEQLLSASQAEHPQWSVLQQAQAPAPPMDAIQAGVQQQQGQHLQQQQQQQALFGQQQQREGWRAGSGGAAARSAPGLQQGAYMQQQHQQHQQQRLMLLRAAGQGVQLPADASAAPAAPQPRPSSLAPLSSLMAEQCAAGSDVDARSGPFGTLPEATLGAPDPQDMSDALTGCPGSSEGSELRDSTLA